MIMTSRTIPAAPNGYAYEADASVTPRVRGEWREVQYFGDPSTTQGEILRHIDTLTRAGHDVRTGPVYDDERAPRGLSLLILVPAEPAR